jgi:hypothetical protein
VTDRLPGVEATACSARIAGEQADTILLVNNDGVPVLVAGHPDWHDLQGEANVSLSIDRGAAAPRKAYMVVNLVMMLVDDSALLGRLREAKTLDWTLPFGRFHADVAGLGAALDRLAACAKAAAPARPPR